jgi:Na+-transporting NADH:ubiquinone oxidoreductase subunit NqrB
MKNDKLPIFPNDPRDYQILFLTLFLALGVVNRDWSLQPNSIAAAIVSCLITQILILVYLNYSRSKEKQNDKLLNQHFLGIQFVDRKILNIIFSCRSALITGLGLSLLLRSNHWQIMALAGCLAIVSKFIFCWQHKHFFNPANFGIISVLLLTNNAWVSPGQWGTDWWFFSLFLCAGGIISNKVGRWETSITFLVTYGGLEALRSFYLGGSWDVWQHQLESGSLLLFAFFMITDPRSIPNAYASRLIWSVAIALITFILRDYFYLSTAMFWALFITSPLTILLDLICSASRFNWNKSVVNS